MMCVGKNKWIEYLYLNTFNHACQYHMQYVI
jgi:hypothetical protein